MLPMLFSPMKKPNKISIVGALKLCLILFLVAMVFAPATHAQVFQGGGLQLPDQSAGSDTEIKGISHEGSLINLIIGWTNFLLPYVNVLSILAIVLAGIMYIASFTSEELHTKAKSILGYVVIGIILVYSAFTIVNTLLQVGGGS
jgi:cytochrome bd-type quinol oxidase subunit 2